jgi:hypothetical protein
MVDRSTWGAAAAPAALGGLIFGAGLFGMSLGCTGDLEAILGGVSGKQALAPMLVHALTHPLGLAPFALPIFLGIWALLVAVARLHDTPALAVIGGLFPFLTLLVSMYAMAPHVCDPGPNALTLALSAGGLFLALAAGIVLVKRDRT